jgi:Spy/CpxP family protein refolding chaperone
MILGTRLWYGFFGLEKDDDAALDRQVEAMCRELGDRGTAGAQQVSESIPPHVQKPALVAASASTPPHTQTPTPALAPTSAPAPASTPQLAAKDSATITTSAAATAPQMMQQPRSCPKSARSDGGGGEPRGSFVDIIAFMREEREHMRQIMLESEKQQQQQRQEYEREIEQLKERPKPAAEVIDERQLAALQTRLQSLHEAKLLTDEELFALEDLIVDCIEVMPTASVFTPTVEKVARMLLVASKVGGDGMLARQLRRKFM